MYNFCEYANIYVLNICSLMAYSLVCLDLYLNPITTRAGRFACRTCFISLVLVSFLFHGGPALSPLSSSMYVGRVLIKLSNN